VLLDDGPADRETHPQTTALRGVERLEHPGRELRVDAGSRIVHRDADAIRVFLLRADDQLSVGTSLNGLKTLNPGRRKSCSLPVAMILDRLESFERIPKLLQALTTHRRIVIWVLSARCLQQLAELLISCVKQCRSEDLPQRLWR
jgi:hypothetical protein